MNKRNIIIYLAGAYTSNPVKNTLIARDYAVKLWDLGYTVISPHLNAFLFERHCKKADYKAFLEGDFTIIRRCDLVVFMPNWKHSKGAKLELAFVKKNNIPYVFIKE